MPLPAHEQPRRHPRPLVVICDISGSMERYSRMLLRFAHALTQRRGTVHSFLFGTRLTNVTRQMKDRDPDAAFARFRPVSRTGRAVPAFPVRYRLSTVTGHGAFWVRARLCC